MSIRGQIAVSRFNQAHPVDSLVILHGAAGERQGLHRVGAPAWLLSGVPVVLLRGQQRAIPVSRIRPLRAAEVISVVS
jgi:hypothetical protein